MNKKAQKSLIEKHKNKIKSFTHSIVYLSLFMLFRIKKFQNSILFYTSSKLMFYIVLYKFYSRISDWGDKM